MIPITQVGRMVQEIQIKPVESNGTKNLVLNNVLAIKQNKETTVFLDFTVWGKLAETIASLFKKGDEIILVGEIRNKRNTIMVMDTEDTEHSNGKEITTVFLLVRGFEFTHGNKK